MSNEFSDPTTLFQTPAGPYPNFEPDMHAPCFCGRDKPFGECCGSHQAVRPPPFGLFLFENYLDKATTDDLVQFAEQQAGEPLMVIDDEASTPDNIVKVLDKRRITERVYIEERRQQINTLIQSTFVDLAQRCFGQTLEWFESPDLMRYKEGGFYVRHADSENKDPTTNTWHKVIDRDLSLLVYLNEGYQGGELSFYNFNYQVRPRAGAAAIFPSDHRYLHQAEMLKKGIRYAIVSWAAVKGVTRISKQPPSNAIMVA